LTASAHSDVLHQARHRDRPLRVYFLAYEDSTETQKYASALRHEKDAFLRLIEDKARMIVPLTQDGRTDIDALTADLFAPDVQQQQQQQQQNRKGGAAALGSGRAASQLSDDERPRVLVGMRVLFAFVSLCVIMRICVCASLNVCIRFPHVF
jgi:hypothetical protein